MSITSNPANQTATKIGAAILSIGVAAGVWLVLQAQLGDKPKNPPVVTQPLRIALLREIPLEAGQTYAVRDEYGNLKKLDDAVVLEFACNQVIGLFSNNRFFLDYRDGTVSLPIQNAPKGECIVTIPRGYGSPPAGAMCVMEDPYGRRVGQWPIKLWPSASKHLSGSRPDPRLRARLIDNPAAGPPADEGYHLPELRVEYRGPKVPGVPSISVRGLTFGAKSEPNPANVGTWDHRKVGVFYAPYLSEQASVDTHVEFHETINESKTFVVNGVILSEANGRPYLQVPRAVDLNIEGVGTIRIPEQGTPPATSTKSPLREVWLRMDLVRLLQSVGGQYNLRVTLVAPQPRELNLAAIHLPAEGAWSSPPQPQSFSGAPRYGSIGKMVLRFGYVRTIVHPGFDALVPIERPPGGLPRPSPGEPLRHSAIGVGTNPISPQVAPMQAGLWAHAKSR